MAHRHSSTQNHWDHDWSTAFSRRQILIGVAAMAVILLAFFLFVSAVMRSNTPSAFPGGTADPYRTVERHIDRTFSEGNPYYPPDTTD